MSEINYKKILKQVIREYPHDLDMIERVINDAKGANNNLKVDFKQIVKSDYWSKNEKIRLLKMSRYNPYNEGITEPRGSGELSTNSFVYMIEHDLRDSFSACLEVFYSYEESYVGRRIERVEAYIRIINMIALNTKGNLEKRTTYLKEAIFSATDAMLNKAFKTSFTGDIVANLTNESIFPIILSCLDTELIGKCLKYVDDISYYLPDAVLTGSKEVVNLLLANGADINYLSPKRSIKWLTPLKTAIKNNDYEMYLFLKSRGAKLDESIEDNDFDKKLLEPLTSPNLNYNALENLKNDENLKEELRFNRCSSPLEYAISLDERMPFKDKGDLGGILINFKSGSKTKIMKTPTWEENYASIIDDLYANTPKEDINYTGFLIAVLATSNPDLIAKYTSLISKSQEKISLKRIIESFLSLRLYQDKEVYTSFLEFLKTYNTKEKPFVLLIQEYYKDPYITKKGIILNDFLKDLFKLMPKKEYLYTPLIVHATDLATVKELEELGYDVNQKDYDGFNILFNLLVNREITDELNQRESELFAYLIRHINLNSKDNKGHTILYYMMRNFDTKDEFIDANPDVLGPKSNLETATSRIIDAIDQEEVCKEEIVHIFDARISSHIGHPGGWIISKFVYQHHKDLFDSLIAKEFPFSDAFYANLFKQLYPGSSKETELRNQIDLDKTKEYVFEYLDKNTDIQKINITKSYNDISSYLNQKTANFEEFARMFIDFNNEIIALKEFLKNTIPKKYDPNRYIEYVNEKYGVTYAKLDDKLLTIVLKCLVHFPDESLETILSLCPNLSINHKVRNIDIGYPYIKYYNPEVADEANYVNLAAQTEDGNVNFSGGLVQYAILSNNLAMLKSLEAMGANLEYIDKVNHTWDMVNSKEMNDYLEGVLGKKEYASLSQEDRKYYLSLTSKKESEGK